MILTVIPFDNYNLFRDCDFVNFLENKKYINRKIFVKQIDRGESSVFNF